MFIDIYTTNSVFQALILTIFSALIFHSILDSATTKYQTKLEEGAYIDWEKPNLNKVFLW